MKKEDRHLLNKAKNSLILSTDLFNRPWDQGRVHAVLILLDHSFEMLLKSAIIERKGKIRDKKATETIGFDKCVNKCHSDANIKFLTDEQVFTLRTINGYRDAAQHYLLDISEQHLYLQAQAGLTLFKDILKQVFDIAIYSILPTRVLPLSTTPPTDLHSFFSSEVEEAKRLLEPGKRHRMEASSKIRPLAIMEGVIKGDYMQPGQGEIKKISKKIVDGAGWESVFPGVASINMKPTGQGHSIELRITKNRGLPVQLVQAGTPDANVVGVKRVNELGFSNLGPKKLAAKLGITIPKFNALVTHMQIQSSEDYFKEIKIDQSKYKRYSRKALKFLKDQLAQDEGIVGRAWREYKLQKQT